MNVCRCGKPFETEDSRRRWCNDCRLQGKNKTGYRAGKDHKKNADKVLAHSDLCHLCRHHGAKTIDHVISRKEWPKDERGNLLPGFDNTDNMLPAHGTMGPTGKVNPCPVCGVLCNQRRKAKPIDSHRSRNW